MSAAGGRLPALRHVRDALSRHHTARILPLDFDVTRMEQDLSRIKDEWWKPHQGPYHNGLWEIVALWAPGGDLHQQRSFGAPFGATEALRGAAYLADVMRAIPGEKNRVRLMRLRPGGHIFRHSDPVHQVGHGSVRVHVPIRTAGSVFFLVNRKRLPMKAGQAWEVDVRFPHEVRNFGREDRIHLVIDAYGSEAYGKLAAAAVPVGTGYLTRYYLAHALPAPARRLLRIGN